MAQDYDSPRSKDEDEESLQALGKSSQNASNDMDDDENAIAEDYELPGADLSNEDASVTVIPMQGDEFICSECFLVKHRSQLAYTTPDGQPGMQGMRRLMFDEAYVEPERTEVLVAPVNPAQPVELHYMHAGDAGADLVTTAHVELGPFQRALVPTGVRIALPAGYVGLVHPRSGLAVKQGVTVLNAPGTIDAGYRGEIKVPLINLDPEHTAVFEPGDRIAQLVIQRYVQAEFIEASVLPGSDRAERGFGSSGV